MAVPRLLPIIAVAIGGVLAVQLLAGAPKLLSGARALAEDVVSGAKPGAPPIPPNLTVANKPAPVVPKPAPLACAPTAAELAKEAGLSPAELQVLQSLGDRRGQLDAREQSLDTQVQLIAAAEAKLDSRIKEMNGLKSDVAALLTQADQQQDSETARLIRVYEAMKPKDAAGRMTLMDDSVRLPMAAKMKERALAAILAQMPAEDAKALTEKLANRLKDSQAVASARTALNPPAAPTPVNTPPAQTAATTPPAATATAAPVKPAAPAADSSAKPAEKPKVAKAKPRAKAKAKPAVKTAQAAAASGAKPAATPPAAGAAPAAAAPSAKAG